MRESVDLDDLLAGASVDPSVFALRPDYRALLIVVSGVRGGPSDEASDAALCRAEGKAAARLVGDSPDALPEVQVWRETFLGFGVKPRQARSSVDALLRRVDAGLPRIDRLTDLYNAISIAHLVPVGGENLDRYSGPPALVRATGDEPFDTVVDGESVVVHPDPGEPVWRDDIGITCRRWNWRQCVRTRLGETTGNALFIFDALEPVSTAALHEAGQELIVAVTAGTTGATAATRLLSAVS